MKKIVIIAALLYVGYAYGDSLAAMGMNLVEKMQPALADLRDFLQK